MSYRNLLYCASSSRMSPDMGMISVYNVIYYVPYVSDFQLFSMNNAKYTNK